MVDYHNPVTISREATAVVKFWHVVDGIFIWEFFATLDFEWDVIQGRRPYRWTIWIYSISRVATLLSIILNMIGFDSATPIHCQVWITFEAAFSYTAFACASLLIVLRIIAVWNRAKIPFVITMGVWVADVALLISGVARIRSAWSPESESCALLNIESTKPAVLGSLISDVVLLLIMLIGVLRLRLNTVGVTGLGYVLWKQGLIWLLLATVAEVPPSVLTCLDLNGPMSLTPAMITMTIAATRMYRSLLDFAHSDKSRDIAWGNGHILSELQAHSGAVPASRMDVPVRMESDQHLTTERSRVSYISTDPHGSYKAHEVSLDVDVEHGPEK